MNGTESDSAGRVEICLPHRNTGMGNSVSQRLGHNDARVVCRQLGFKTSTLPGTSS